MTKTRKLIFVLILSLFILNSGFVIAANTVYSNNPDIQALNNKIEENKNKIENLKKATEEYADKIEEYKDKSTTLENQLALLENQIIKVELDIKTNQLEIDQAKLQIESMEYIISKDEEEIASQKDSLIEYIKLINKNDQKSYLEILILNDSFSDFFSQLSYIEGIQTDIQQTVERLKLLKTAIELQKAKTERQKETLENLKQRLKSREEKLIEENATKELLLSESISTESKFQQLLVETKQRQNEIDSQILNLQQQVKAKLDRLKDPNRTVSNTLISWPIAPPHYITSYFHDPDYPYRYIFEHPAIDVRAKQGTKIRAPADGYVARTKNAGYGYNYIIIIHDNGLSTVYGHVSAIYAKADTYVQAGDIIGLTGGMPGTLGAGSLSSGPHLHFEVRLNGLPVNPLEYLP